MSHPVAVTVAKDARVDAARVALEAAIKLRPDDPLAHLHFGDLLLTTGDPAAAVPHYEIAVRGMPKAISPRLNLAVALGAIGRIREATECAESVLQIDPNNAEAKAILASLPHVDRVPPLR